MSKVILDYLNNGESKKVLPVAKDESLVYFLIGTTPGEKEIEVRLQGEGAEAKIFGIFIGNTGEMKIHTLQHHEAPNTTSDLLMKSVVSGDTHFDYNGMIKIAKYAQGSNAYQKNNNLVMSEHARVDTKPELEILANEVRCTHGATVGKLDKESIFYLQSRGIDEAHAQKLMIEGFLGEVIERIPEGDEREKVSRLVKKELLKISNYSN